MRSQLRIHPWENIWKSIHEGSPKSFSVIHTLLSVGLGQEQKLAVGVMEPFQDEGPDVY